MSYYGFTVTQVVYDFTATVTTPLTLALQTTQTSVTITDNTTTVTVINQVQPVTVSGAQQFNQDLNTFDNVSFASVTTPYVYGFAQQPVYFPTGIAAGFYNSIDFGIPGEP